MSAAYWVFVFHVFEPGLELRHLTCGRHELLFDLDLNGTREELGYVDLRLDGSLSIECLAQG